MIDRCCVINTANTTQLPDNTADKVEHMKYNSEAFTYMMSRKSREFRRLMARLKKVTARNSFHHSALVAAHERLLDYFPIAEMLWRRPTEHNECEAIDCTDSEANAIGGLPEDNTTKTDDTSKDETSEVDMSTDSSSSGLNSVPKQTGRT